MGRHLDIQPATIAQVQRLDDGSRVLVDDDVAGVAQDLRAIDPSLRLHLDVEQQVYVVSQVLQGREHLVTTSQTCDQRLVARVRQVASPGYNLADELEAAEAAANREQDRLRREWVGEIGERLAHALRKDLGGV